MVDIPSTQASLYCCVVVLHLFSANFLRNKPHNLKLCTGRIDHQINKKRSIASPSSSFSLTFSLASTILPPVLAMALQAAYTQFLAAPNSSLLAADASLHYITSTTSYHGATDIIKHFSTLRNQLKKKKEILLSVVEGAGSIAVEAEVSFVFLTSGGPFLPGLDDNFLADRTVSLPIVSNANLAQHPRSLR